MTADDVWEYIQKCKRVDGQLPKLKQIVEHFDSKLLNVMLCLGELKAEHKAEIRKIFGVESKAKQAKRSKNT